MALSRTLRDLLLKDAERIEAIVIRMVARIERENPQEAEHARAYWAAHIRGALGTSYGGMQRGWPVDDE